MEIYERPNSRWVADFIGDVNLFEGRVGDDGESVEGTAAGRLRVAAKIDAEPHTTVWVAVRPEKMRISHEQPLPSQNAGPENCVAATVVEIGYLGDLSIYKLRIADGSLRQSGDRQYRPAAVSARSTGIERVWLSFAPEAATVLPR